MKHIIYMFLFGILLTGCSNEKQESIPTIQFSFSDRDCFDHADIYKEVSNICLENSDKSLISGYPNVLIDEDIFVFNNKQVLRFNQKGEFLNSIGRIGQGPGEYSAISDISLNKKKKVVEILATNSIFRYNYRGEYIDQKKIDIPAFSFTIDNQDQYWFNIGNNKTSGQYKLSYLDQNLNLISNNIEITNNTLPVTERNFINNDIISFRESMSHQVYQLENGKINKCYDFRFNELGFPDKMDELSMEELFKALATKQHAIIRSFLENKNFMFLFVIVKNKTKVPECYHWIINKNTKKELLVKLKEITPESFLFSPQILNEKNELVFIGKDHAEDDLNTDNNPNIYSIDLTRII